jgi:hypothetical protein
VRSNARSYYNALLAEGRVHALTLTEAQRDLERATQRIELMRSFSF